MVADDSLAPFDEIVCTSVVDGCAIARIFLCEKLNGISEDVGIGEKVALSKYATDYGV